MNLTGRALIHHYIFLFCLYFILIGFGFGTIFRTFGMFLLALNWIIEGGFKEKVSKFKSLPVLWSLLLFYVIHVLGLLWSQNVEYGLKDISVKLALFIFPVVLATSTPMEKSEWLRLLKFFVWVIVAATMWSMAFYLDVFPLQSKDVRTISRFDSHIRFSMVIVFAICICYWIFSQHSGERKNIVWLVVLSWLVIFLFILSSLNGIVTLFALLITLTVLSIRKGNRIIKWVVPGILLAVTVYAFINIRNEYHEFFDEKEMENEKMEHWSPTRDLYFHEMDNLDRENGFFIWRYVAYPETKRAWNRLSKIHFDSLDKNGMPMKFTVIRYVTSLGYRKDSIGMSKLSNEDVKNIEEGIPNFKLAKASPFRKRIYEIFWELKDYQGHGNVSKHSLIMKLEYWKMAIRIINKNPLFGTGTGDIQDAFNDEYVFTNSHLKKEEDRRRAHNQFLETEATLGIIGLLILLIATFHPLLQLKKLHWLYLPFFLIIVLSYLTEDTLENQLGVSIYSFFNSLLLFQIKKD